MLGGSPSTFFVNNWRRHFQGLRPGGEELKVARAGIRRQYADAAEVEQRHRRRIELERQLERSASLL